MDNTKKRILFVDDEPKVLEGLQRMLRSMRHEWDMAFAGGGAEALEMLKNGTFNVIVTDMRMPGMDGYQLLNQVKELYPQIVRFILSGHSDKDMILKSIAPVHQYITKPCDPAELKATIARTCALRDLLDDKFLVQLVSSIDHLPSLPALYTEVLNEINSPTGSLNKIGEIISKDVAMSAKILQLVNSAFFGLPKHVATPHRAVCLLGVDTIKALTLSVKIFSQFSQSKLTGYSISNLWNHSILTGVLARSIATNEDRSQSEIDEAFMAGLLHDVGKLILLDKLPQKSLEIVKLANSTNCYLWEAEQKILGTTHAQVGAYLIGIWGLSESIVEAIAFHHSPGKCPNDRFSILSAVHLADVLEQGEGADEKTKPTAGLDMVYLTRIGGADRINAWRAIRDESIGHEDASDDHVDSFGT
jgi:HD-like signal output (HDOD) protein/ActR/RegA family two-component response regulator